MAEKIRVQVIEGSPLDESGLRCLLNKKEDIELIHHGRCCSECGMNCVAESPDVVMIEISSNGHKSLDCIRQIKVRHPETRILSVCSSGDPVICKIALSAGATGFVSKQIPVPILLQALSQVALGKTFVEPWVAKRMVEAAHANVDLSPFEILPPREHTILQLILSGEISNHIASRLHISSNTLGNHRAHIKRKLKFSGPDQIGDSAWCYIGGAVHNCRCAGCANAAAGVGMNAPACGALSARCVTVQIACILFAAKEKARSIRYVCEHF